MHVRVSGSATPSNSGLLPTKVSALTFKLQASCGLPSVAGLLLQAKVAREGWHTALPGSSAKIPGDTRIDRAARMAPSPVPVPPCLLVPPRTTHVAAVGEGGCLRPSDSQL